MLRGGIRSQQANSQPARTRFSQQAISRRQPPQQISSIHLEPIDKGPLPLFPNKFTIYLITYYIFNNPTVYLLILLYRALFPYVSGASTINLHKTLGLSKKHQKPLVNNDFRFLEFSGNLRIKQIVQKNVGKTSILRTLELNTMSQYSKKVTGISFKILQNPY